MSFTASREDFKLYLTCPRKLALRTLDVKVWEGKRTVRLPLSHAIGVSGEKLTEGVLEIIASLQTDRSKGEHIEVYEERSENIKKAVKTITGALSILKKTHIENEILGKGVESIVESTVEEAFTRVKGSSSLDLESYEGKLKEEMKKGFPDVLKVMLDKIPKILAVYKQPVLRNRDTCSLGFPDYQVETEKGHILIEVKNLANLSMAIHEAKDSLLYYNSLLADQELGDSVWRSRLLPSPAKSLIVIPRQGVVKEALEPIPNFREIAVEIWKIKRAALVDGVLPDVRQVSSVCRRCGYKRLCEKMKVEQIEPAKPLPLIYAIAEYEIEDVEESKPPAYLNLPSGFWKVYLELKRRVGEGDEKAKDELNRMDEYLNWLHLKRQEDVCKVLYRVMPDEFDSWGGLNFLKENYVKVANTARILYPHNEDNVKVILKVARKRWES